MKRKLDFLLRTQNVDAVFEDDTLIVLCKPAHLLVLPDRYDQTLPNLQTLLRGELGTIFTVHRIDKETSGLVLFAKTVEAHASLNQQFENRSVSKLYKAIVQGEPSEEHGEIDLPLSERNHRMRVDEKNGKESLTEFSVLERFHGYALIEARPRTGRMHQIRVHLKEIGLPILADPLYGDGEPFFLSAVKPNYKVEEEERPLLSRTALHASSLRILHPISGQKMSFEAEIPKDMRTVLKYLRKFRSEDSGSQMREGRK
ncbi:MAG: RluA family pseudouridine synthase [Bacteroidota bacterium]